MAPLVARSFEQRELDQAHRGHSHPGVAAECSAAVDVALACFIVADAEEFIPQNCAISCGICVGSWNSMQWNCFHRSGSTAHDADRCREQRQRQSVRRKREIRRQFKPLLRRPIGCVRGIFCPNISHGMKSARRQNVSQQATSAAALHCAQRTFGRNWHPKTALPCNTTARSWSW